MRGREWFPSDKATHEWLDSYKKSTRFSYQTVWKHLLEYTGMTGDEIIESRKTDNDYAWEKRVLEFKQWMITNKKYSENSAVLAGAAARSFFAFHRMPLRFRKTESARMTEGKRKYEDYRFSLEDLRKMADVADLTEKYVVVAGKSFGFRAGDFLRLRRGDVEPYIEREPPISIGEYATQKEGVPAFPFIDSDAKPVIQLVLEKMNREGRTDPNERMLRYRDNIQVSRILQRLADNAGIQHGIKRVRFHCLRKFLTDRLSSFMSESKWKQVVGKKISEGAYISPDSLRDDYQRAMAETCFSRLASEADIELLAKKQALIILAKMQGISEEEQKKIFRERKVKTPADEVQILEQLIEREGEAQTQHNGDCQEIVSEDELPQLLAEGWRFVATLQNGKAVVER